VNPSAEARYTASPVLGPRPAQNVQQNESSMSGSGSFSENIFDYRGNKFHRIASATTSNMPMMVRRPMVGAGSSQKSASILFFEPFKYLR
jgi:hypothetical protein